MSTSTSPSSSQLFESVGRPSAGTLRSDAVHSLRTDCRSPGVDASSRGSHHSEERSPLSHRQVEEAYDSFVCPLTLQVMREPVTIENGQTFEKTAIQKWFKERREKAQPPSCPVTGMQLNSTGLMPSLALQQTIEEWRSRNEMTRLSNAMITLSSNSGDDEKALALVDICDVCSDNEINKQKARTIGLIPAIVGTLKWGERLRCASLATLRILATDNDENKESIGNTDAIRGCFKCLQGKAAKEKQEAILLLTELAKFPPLCEKIGAVNGAILILVGLTSSSSENVVVIEKAEETLDYLEASDQNVKQMAENGRLQPLTRQLVRGTDAEKLDLVSYLAELSLSREGKQLVAKTASKELVKMLDSETVAVKEAALKCLNHLSQLPENARVLIDAGVLQPVVRDLFSIGSTNQLPMKVKEITAAILANIVNSGVNLITLPVNLTSEDVIHSLLHLISSTGPATEAKLLQVLVGLASSTITVRDLVSSIQSAGATSTLIQFLEAPQREIRLNCLKLLYLISPLMGQILADGLRGTTGQLGLLVRLFEASGITEEQAAAAGLLGNLPAIDVNLTNLLFKEQAFPIVAKRLSDLYKGTTLTGGGRHAGDFKVGLAAILCRFTYNILDNPNVLALAQEYDLTTLFTDLLKLGELDEIKRQSALALQNLSKYSKQLSHLPEKPVEKGLMAYIRRCFKRKSEPKVNLCSVHGGVCSPKETFCLVEAGAVAFLGSNLDHRNEQVVEACLGALATLLEDKASRDAGIDVLNRASLVPPILEIMKDHKTELLWRRSVWMVEKFLANRNVAHFLSLDPSVHSGLVEAYRNGSLSIKQTAERALKQLNKIPNFSAYVR